MANGNGEQITSFLLTFIDFLYAIIFGVVLQQFFEIVIFDESLVLRDKTTRTLLVLGVFYFLMGDWIQARLLTIRNPFRKYRRFFIELMIAFCGYGAASEVLKAKIFFLVYIILVLILGALWADETLREHKNSLDKKELLVIKVFQPITAIAGGSLIYLWHYFLGEIMTLGGAVFLLFLGWCYDLIYELFSYTSPDISGGPSPIFLRKEGLEKIRSWLKIRR